MKKKLVVLMGIICSSIISNTAMAADTQQSVQSESIRYQQIAAAERLMMTKGTITDIEFGSMTVKGEGNYPEIKLRIGMDTMLVDGKNGVKTELARLQKGDTVTAYYSNRLTRSIPPQGYAAAVVVDDLFNKTESGFYMKVKAIQKTKNGIVVVDGDRDRMITVSDKLLKKCGKIQQGDELIIWYRAMTMSIPAMANADKVVVLRSYKD